MKQLYGLALAAVIGVETAGAENVTENNIERASEIIRAAGR